LPRVAAQETQQLLSEIPKTDSPEADTSRQIAKQIIIQASKLAYGNESRAITSAGLSGLIENQAARTKILARVSSLARSDPDLTEPALIVLAEAFKTTENVSAKNQIQETIAQIRDKSAPAPTPAEESTPAPTPAEESTPAPTSAEESTPAPTSAEESTPAPTSAEESTPAPTPAEQSAPAPTPDVRRAQTVFSAVIVYPGQARETDAKLCKQKLEARGTPSKLDDTSKLEGLNPTIPSKMEVRYSDPKLKGQVQNLLKECKEWLNLDGATKLLPSRLVDTDTIEVWLPR